jgi:hypothetical protein
MADGITFAGEPVLLELDSQLREYLEARWPASTWPHSRNRFNFQAFPYPFFQKNRAGIFASPYPEIPSPQINELIVPTGASRYARTLVVVDRETLETIATSLWGSSVSLGSGSLPTSWGDSQNAAELKFLYNEKTFVHDMHSLAPVLLDATGTRQLWLLPLVDERYFWNRTAELADLESIDSWESLVASLSTILDTTLSVGAAVDANYGEPDKECLRDSQASCGALLDTIALSIGRRFVFESISSHTLRSASGDTTKLNTNLELPDLRLGGLVPRTAIQRKAVGVGRKTFDYWGNADDLAIEEADIDDGSESKARLVVYCAWFLENFTNDYTGLPEVDPDSQYAFESLVSRIANDHLAWGAKQYTASFAGVAEWDLCGHDDYLSIACTESNSGGLSLTTKVVSLPPDFGPRVSIAQRVGRYIHPHEVARFTITADDDGLRKFARIIKAEGPYDGEVKPITIITLTGEGEVGDVLTCHYEHGIGWREIASSCRRIKFRATADIAYRTLPVIVLNSTDKKVLPGNKFNVYDPNNLWSSVTKDCIGFATFNGMLDKWEIETCSLPANEIRVKLDKTMKAKELDDDGEEFKAFTSLTYYLRSTYPNVMRPPQCQASCTYTWNRSQEIWVVTGYCPAGCECGPAPTKPPIDDPPEGEEPEDYVPPTVDVPCVSYSDKIEIEFTNPEKFDAMCDSYVYLRRINNADWGNTIESAPNTGSATNYRWEVSGVTKRKARIVSFIFVKDSPPEGVNDFWNGFDPFECDDEFIVEYPLGEPCNGSLVLADYDPNTDHYIARDTQASMLGDPVTDSFVSTIANDDCGIKMSRVQVIAFYPKNYYGDCERNVTVTPVQLGVETPVVVTLSSESCGNISYAYQNIRAFVCGNPVEFNDFDINFDGVEFVTAASFGPPSCSSEAIYEWDGDNWSVITPCENGCESEAPTDPPESCSDAVYIWDGEVWDLVFPCDEECQQFGEGPTAPGTEINEEFRVPCRARVSVPCSSKEDSQCGLNLQMGTICADTGSGAPSPTVVHVRLPLEEVEVVTKVYDNYTDAIIVDSKVIYVCNWKTAPSNQIAIGPCDTGSSGGGPGCTGYATYGWNVSTQSWFIVLNCENGCQPTELPTEPPENPEEYAEIQVSCIEGEI